MSTKSSTVTARVQPEIKEQAEAVLEKLGLPVSVVIDTLYRQIIMTGGIPYSLTVPKLQTLDKMTEQQFDEALKIELNEAKQNKGMNISDAFKTISEEI